MEIKYVNERSILNTVKKLCIRNIKESDIVVDMTVGNGNDTLFLANLIPNGYVFGFDIQEDAINKTLNLLKENNITNYKLFQESHENIDITLKDYKNNISLILFNLGYLPGGNKNIMTNHESTLNAVKKSLNMLKDDGTILIVFYPHKEGLKEALSVRKYLDTSNISYTQYYNTTNTYAPYLVEIKKK